MSFLWGTEGLGEIPVGAPPPLRVSLHLGLGSQQGAAHGELVTPSGLHSPSKASGHPRPRLRVEQRTEQGGPLLPGGPGTPEPQPRVQLWHCPSVWFLTHPASDVATRSLLWGWG